MSELAPDQEARDASRAEIKSSPAASPPRWVGPIGIAIGVVVVCVIVVLHLTGVVGPGAH